MRHYKRVWSDAEMFSGACGVVHRSFCFLVFLTNFCAYSLETSLTQREMLPFLYACALEGVCADSSVSRRRSKTDNHLYRLQCFACSAYMVATSRSKREMTAEGWKTQIGQGEKEAEEEGYPCCEGRLLMHKNIYTGTVSGWQLTAAIMEESSHGCDTEDESRTSLVEVTCSFPLKGCTHHLISAPATLPDPHIIFHHLLWHLVFLLPPLACSTPPQVPKVVGGKGKAYIHQAGSQTQQINCELVPGPLRVNLAEITGQFKHSGR